MTDIEITTEHKNLQQIECIICLDEFTDNNYIELPNKNSSCGCIYKIHDECLEKCDRKCPICKTDMKSNEKPEEDISNEDKKYSGITAKYCNIIGYIGAGAILAIFFITFTSCLFLIPYDS